jgi:hypothetical protein
MIPSSHNRTPVQTEQKVIDCLNSGMSGKQTARDLGIGETTVRRIKKRNAQQVSQGPQVSTASQVEYLDKKVGGLNWRDSIPLIESIQKLRKDTSWSQRAATIRVGDGTSPVAIMAFGDQHIGAVSTDYARFVEMTDLIINTPNLFCILVGDEVEMAIKLRSVAEVCAQVIDPFLQAEFIESWLEEIMHKVICSTFSNHSTEREEKASGNSIIKSIIAKRIPFFTGIGHPDIVVGEQTYKFALAHKFAGVTMLDATAGCKRYMRNEYPEAEIAIQGDCHRAGVSIYNEGNSRRIAISSGTLNIHSGYAERYFSLFTSDAFPVVVLYPDKHLAIPFFNIEDYLHSIGTQEVV